MPLDPNHIHADIPHAKTVHLPSQGWRYGCSSTLTGDDKPRGGTTKYIAHPWNANAGRLGGVAAGVAASAAAEYGSGEAQGGGMKFGSVCSGIEAASVAWHPLGWQAAWFAEIEPFPCAVLAHHYPTVPNLGDMTTIAPRILKGEVDAPDVLAGGTPCQDNKGLTAGALEGYASSCAGRRSITAAAVPP